MHNAYTLDCPSLPGDLTERRIALLHRELPFKLYPLNERFTSISQLIHTKRREFLDADGKLIKYKPTRFVKVQCAKVLRVDKTWNGKNRIMTKLPVPFVTEDVGNYLMYIQEGKSYYFFGFSDERQASHRKKI